MTNVRLDTPPTQRPPWHWPPRPFAFVVAGCVLALALVANFPAWETPHPELEDGRWGLHFNVITEYEHGWPLVYARRDLAHRTSAQGPPSAWHPWEGPGQWSTMNLLLDLGLWTVIVIVAGLAAQWWRSQRRAIWQLGLRDLLIITAVAAVAFAWLADQRAEYLREEALQTTLRMRPGSATVNHQMRSRVPAFLPKSWQARYSGLFDRPSYFYSSGDTDIACQHRHVISMSETAIHSEISLHLSRMPQLEAIDLCFVKFPYFDVTRQSTVLRDLPPMPNLRGINLYKTNATDADLAWLATCPRLEIIDLGSTTIGDPGLAHLAGLAHLKRLSLSNDRISDRGCRAIAGLPAIEELEIASRQIHDAGVTELAGLQTLKSLKISASASEEAFATLRSKLPQCKVVSHAYRPAPAEPE